MSELAEEGIQVAVTYRATTLFDAHRDDPELGHRILAEEAADAGEVMTERTAWQICSANDWFSRFGKKPQRDPSKKAGPPVHGDLVQRDFTADAPHTLWSGNITDIARLKAGCTRVRLKMCSP